jgi:hypothetical protein
MGSTSLERAFRMRSRLTNYFERESQQKKLIIKNQYVNLVIHHQLLQNKRYCYQILSSQDVLVATRKANEW